jgi:hypothetical protein
MVRFNEPIAPATITADNVSLRYDDDASVVATTLSLSADGRTLSVQPDALLDANTEYSLRLGAALEDLAGNRADYTYSHSFTTGEFAVEDTAAPSIEVSSPSDGVAGVPVNTLIELRFSEAIIPMSITEDEAVSVQFSADDTEVQFTPPSVLFAANSSINHALPTVSDLSGNTLSGTLSFNTSDRMDFQPPTLLQVSPASGATEVPVNTVIRLRFDEAINPLTAHNDEVFYLWDESVLAKVPATASLSADNKVLTLVPNAVLTAGTSYRMNWYGLRDYAYNYGYGSSASFATAAAEDNTAPTVVSRTFMGGETGVPRNPQINVTFSEAIDLPLLLATGQVTLVRSNDQEVIDTTITADADRTRISIKVVDPLDAYTSYTVRVSGVSDRAGNQLASDLSFTFTTGVQVDIEPGQIVASAPSHQSVAAPLNAVIELKLSEPVDPSTVSEASFRLHDDTAGADVSGSVSLLEGGTLIRFVPDANLAASSRFYVSIGGYYANLQNYVTDLAGNVVSYHTSTGQIYFDTGTDVDNQVPVLQQVGIANGATNIPLNVRIAIRYDDAINMARVIDGIQLLDDTSARVDLVAGFNATSKVVTLTPRLNLAAGSLYSLTIDPMRDLAGNVVVGSTSIGFATGTDVDNQTGTVSTYAPAHQATNVALDAVITLTLSEPADPATVTAESFRLYDYTHSTQVDGVISLSGGNTVLTFTPNSALQADTRYYMSISGYYANGQNYVTDLAGNLIGYNTSSYGPAYFNTTP